MGRITKECNGLCSSPAFLRDHGQIPIYDEYNRTNEKRKQEIESIEAKACRVCEKVYYGYSKWSCPCCKSKLTTKLRNSKWNDHA